MPFHLDALCPLDFPRAGWPDLPERIARLLDFDARRYRGMWNYYRNPTVACSPATLGGSSTGVSNARPYRQAQEWGLPARITGALSGSDPASLGVHPVSGIARKEVVIENDIGWRIDTLVDYLFGKPLVIRSSVQNPARRAVIECVLEQVFTRHGGTEFFQQLALIGAVYGFVDVLVKLDPCAAHGATNRGLERELTNESSDGIEPGAAPGTPVLPHAGPVPCLGESPDEQSRSGDTTAALDGPVNAAEDRDALSAGQDDNSSPASIARHVRFEIVEPARALPLLDPHDYRQVVAYAQVWRENRTEDPAITRSRPRSRWFDRLLRTRRPTGANGMPAAAQPDGNAVITEIISARRWQRFEGDVSVASGTNSLGEIPLVHIQNTAEPFAYAGMSDVEPLMPLQDELNTRLSDRAHRITMQSFRMYLGKGIENFGEMPVAPGRMWMTDNPDAQVIEFGGDSPCPSEQSAITEVREAMDKTSAVTPIAAGAIKGRIGRLTSAAALRVTMLALLAKTERKRTTYGAGIQRMCELALAWLDCAGLFHTTPDEREVELSWPSPLPDSEQDRLEVAESKLKVGIPQDTVLRELGY